MIPDSEETQKRLRILTLVAFAHILLVVLDLKRQFEYVKLLPDAD